MRKPVRVRSFLLPVWYLILVSLAPLFGRAQSLTADSIIRGVDAAVAYREQNLLGYTVIEHYSVFRNRETEHPSAEMTVKTTYRKDHGKSYEVLSQRGSELLLRQVLDRLLDSEREMTQPANRPQAIITTANYSMALKGADKIGSQDCYILSITPRRNSTYLFRGTLWVDAKDQSILQLEGVAARSPSMLSGPAQLSRTYQKIDGFPVATRATATSTSWLFGQTTIQIEYSGYQILLNPERP